MPIDFDHLWQSYPVDHYPCRDAADAPRFPNQCAIRFGISLAVGGVDLGSFGGVRCWFSHAQPHVLRGEELAAWMASEPAVFGPVTVRQHADETTFAGRRGLLFCRDFWGPGNRGDDIDLWNRSYMKTGDPGYIARSREVWFWSLDEATPSAAPGRAVRTPRKARARRKRRG